MGPLNTAFGLRLLQASEGGARVGRQPGRRHEVPAGVFCLHERKLPMAKKSFKTPSYQEIQDKLESLKEEHGRHRTALYKLLQGAAEIAVLVEANEKLKSRFLKKGSEKDVLHSALIFIFNAK